MARLQKLYREKIAAELKEKFGYTSVMEVPRLSKITLNMGVGEAVADKKVLDHAVADLTKIAGQKPVVTKAKKAIAGFKIREGQAIGCMVTLRGVQMYEFLDRFVTVALPRVRDFRGISGRSFDGHVVERTVGVDHREFEQAIGVDIGQQSGHEKISSDGV
jgi:large subunit ribosomal protein L5